MKSLEVEQAASLTHSALFVSVGELRESLPHAADDLFSAPQLRPLLVTAALQPRALHTHTHTHTRQLVRSTAGTTIHHITTLSLSEARACCSREMCRSFSMSCSCERR